MLRERLVAIYETGSPDVVSVVLESETWSQVNARADYLSQIQDYDDAVADRVKGLRDAAKAAVERMAEIRRQLKEARDAIAAKERAAAAAKDEAESVSRLKGLRRSVTALESARLARAELSDNLAVISEDGQLGRPVPAGRRSPNPGPERHNISKAASVASGHRRPQRQSKPPLDRPPVIWGGGHGSFERTATTDGIGQLSTPGGGFLSSPSTHRLSTWGEPGRGSDHRNANAGHARVIIAGSPSTPRWCRPRWTPNGQSPKDS